MRRTVPAFLPAIALAGMLLAVPAAAQKPKLALVVKSLANEFAVTMTQSALAHQKQHPERYTLVAHGIRNETDVAAQPTDGVETIVDPAPTPSRFYRLVTPREP